MEVTPNCTSTSPSAHLTAEQTRSWFAEPESPATGQRLWRGGCVVKTTTLAGLIGQNVNQLGADLALRRVL